MLSNVAVNLPYSSPDVDLVDCFVQVGCHRAVGVDVFQEFDVYIFYPLSVLPEFALSRKLSHSRHRVEYYIIGTSPSVDL